MVNPADLEALEEAARLAGSRGARVTAVAVGPQRLEDALWLASSMGAARAIRVWDPCLERADAVAEGRLLGRILEILRPTLLFTGARLLDRGDAPGPALAAASAGISCCTSAVEIEVGDRSAQVLRKGDRGARQRVELPVPCAILFAAGFRELRYPDLDAVMAAMEAELEVWGLPELGLDPREVGEQSALLQPEGFSFPRPRPVRVPTPDASLPAFARIVALLSGGIQPREGRMHFGSAEEMADQLFQIFRSEGLVSGEEA
jgi:electron transfer flavoprotein beta subunit